MPVKSLPGGSGGLSKQVNNGINGATIIWVIRFINLLTNLPEPPSRTLGPNT